MVCTFFGHHDCYDLDSGTLRKAIEELILEGVEEFLVGDKGMFDRLVQSCLRSLRVQYPHIRYQVVLAYLPTKKQPYDDFSETLYPEGLETIHPKYAIEYRNKWMISQADCCICYINQTWGGAYKFARMAHRKGLKVHNLGTAKEI